MFLNILEPSCKMQWCLLVMAVVLVPGLQARSDIQIFSTNTVFNESSDYVQFFCQAKVPVRWKVSGLLNSSRIEVAIEWQRSKEIYRSSLGVVLEQKLTGYITCEAVSENDRKKYQPAMIYIYVTGAKLIVDGIDTGDFELIPARKDPINCRIYNVTCRLYDPYLRPVLFDQRGNNLMADKSYEIDYDPRDGFTVHKCGDVVTTFKCTAQAFVKLEQKEYTRKQLKPSFHPNETDVYTMKNIPTRFVCNEAKNFTFYGVAGKKTKIIPNVVSIPHHNNTWSSFILLENTGQYTQIFCNSSSYKKSWNIIKHNNTRDFQGSKNLSFGEWRYDSRRDILECYNEDPNLIVKNVFCENTADCYLKENCLKENTCLNHVKNGASLKPNCLTVDNPYRSGLFYCKSTGGHILKHYFTGLDQAFYFVEDDIPDDALFRITKTPSKFYYGLDNTMDVMCKYSRFLLADGGSLWVRYNDGSILELKNETVGRTSWEDSPLSLLHYFLWEYPRRILLDYKHLGRYHELVKRKFYPTPDMTAVICKAPTNYELGWKNVTEPLDIEVSKPPAITDEKLDVHFYFEDAGTAKIICSVTGNPPPSIWWEKLSDDDSSEASGKDSFYRTENQKITFNSVSKNIEGKYKCSAHSVRHYVTVFKIFTVTVDYKPSFWSTKYLLPIILTIVIACSTIWFYRRRSKRATRLLRELTERDLQDFFNGVILQCKNGNDQSSSNAVDHAVKMPYNNLFELKLENVDFENKQLLGKGQFGIVYKAKLFPEEKQVAVKTVPENVDVDSFKTVLTELKVHMYLGFHPNIVEFLGAITKDIQKLNIFLVMELCENGDLNAHLKNLKAMEVENGFIVPKDQLVRWCSEIAFGLEHLTKRKIVHGDLATRNILLSRDLVAKISDFGLSKKTADYDNYVKKGTKGPMPWKWMAIESLTMFEFSKQTDVWSFGVTAWEIFALGEKPYPNYTWDNDFVECLRSGMRLPMPSHATDEIYSKLKECWSEISNMRPNIGDIKQFFEDRQRCNIK